MAIDLENTAPLSNNVVSIQDDSHNKFQYIPGFDNLRGFAAIFVMLLHGSYGFFIGGWIGVDLFFVLSGYLITSLLYNEYLYIGTISISKFYVRRILRLFAPLIICIMLGNILWSVSQPFFYPGANQKMATLAGLFYFTNLIPGGISGNMAHLWSLAVEEHFYLFWPIVSLLIFKTPAKLRIILFTILIIAAAAFKIYNYNYPFHFPGGLINIDPRFTFARIDGMLLGAMLSFALSYPQIKAIQISKSVSTVLLLIIGLIFLVILFKLEEAKLYFDGGFILTDLICVATIFIAIKNPKHYLLSNKVFRWLGKRSYGIYVYHLPIFTALESFRIHHSTSNFVLITVLRFAFSIILAGISYKYIETPILKFKKRYSVSKTESTDKPFAIS